MVLLAELYCTRSTVISFHALTVCSLSTNTELYCTRSTVISFNALTVWSLSTNTELYCTRWTVISFNALTVWSLSTNTNRNLIMQYNNNTPMIQPANRDRILQRCIVNCPGSIVLGNCYLFSCTSSVLKQTFFVGLQTHGFCQETLYYKCLDYLFVDIWLCGSGKLTKYTKAMTHKM